MGDNAQGAESFDVCLIDNFNVADGRSYIRCRVSRLARLYGVQGRSDSAIANGVEVEVKTEAVGFVHRIEYLIVG